jgi:hypothetical protein
VVLCPKHGEKEKTRTCVLFVTGSVARAATAAAEALQTAQAAQRLPLPPLAQAASTVGVHLNRTLPPWHQRDQVQQEDDETPPSRS